MKDRKIPCPQCSDGCEDAQAICDFCGGQGYIFRSGEPWGGKKAESAKSPLRQELEVLIRALADPSVGLLAEEAMACLRQTMVAIENKEQGVEIRET